MIGRCRCQDLYFCAKAIRRSFRAGYTTCRRCPVLSLVAALAAAAAFTPRAFVFALSLGRRNDFRSCHAGVCGRIHRRILGALTSCASSAPSEVLPCLGCKAAVLAHATPIFWCLLLPAALAAHGCGALALPLVGAFASCRLLAWSSDRLALATYDAATPLRSTDVLTSQGMVIADVLR